MFVSNHYVGSKNDYTIFQETCDELKPYLRKRPSETNDPALYRDRRHVTWVVVADKAYLGPDTDTPGVRRIVPKRSNMRGFNPIENREICAVRVVVEQFFGRLKMNWTLFNNRYRGHHGKVDILFPVACLLTNYHLEANHPDMMDYKFYQQCLNRERQMSFERDQRRDESNRRQRERRQRLRNDF